MLKELPVTLGKPDVRTNSQLQRAGDKYREHGFMAVLVDLYIEKGLDGFVNDLTAVTKYC